MCCDSIRTNDCCFVQFTVNHRGLPPLPGSFRIHLDWMFCLVRLKDQPESTVEENKQTINQTKKHQLVKSHKYSMSS